jgi:ribA/ribD-fused uncharacterized protein
MSPKITKAQCKNLERIRAWLNDEPFKENHRDKNPKVPILSVQDVLEQYIPPDITGAGQYFTPVEMGMAALEPFQLDPRRRHPVRILEPCAGIGHLASLFSSVRGVILDAYEMEKECVRIGQKLFPWANWHHRIPFYDLEQIEGQYELVVANPPIGARRGMSPGARMSDGRCTRSEHIFLELIARALRPGGKAVVLAPYNYLDRLPKALRAWLDDRLFAEYSLGPLPGRFALTSIQLHAYYFTRLGDPYELVDKAELETNDLTVSGLSSAATKPVQIGMFPAGEDLPLFSGTSVHVQLGPFVPQPVARQLPLLEMRPRFGEKVIGEKAIKFHRVKDKFGCFSNFSPHPIKLKGKLWPTSEHFFQAQKFAGTEHEEKIRLAKSPMIAARMGRSRQRPLRPDWEAVKDDIMRRAVLAKFTQHPELRAILLTTGDARLIEHTKKDSYWGDGSDGRGKNMLGEILMEIREKLRQNL